MVFSLSRISRIQVTEEFDGSGPVGAGRLQYSGYDLQSTIRSDAVAPAVPVSMFAYFEKALTAGAATIDLTALEHDGGENRDGTGLKVQSARFTAPADNAESITITPGASDGYTIVEEMELLPGETIDLQFANTRADIAIDEKNIDLAGTGTDKIRYSIVMG